MQRLGSTIAFAAGLAFASPLVLAATQAPNEPAHLEVTADGPILLSSSGRTLYVDSADKTGQSTCKSVFVTEPTQRNVIEGYTPEQIWTTKTCVDKWPAYVADANAQPSGDFGLVDHEGGGKQWTFRSQPLYFSVKDQKLGDRWGATFQFTSTAGAGRGGVAQQGRGLGGPFRYASVPFDAFPPLLRLARFENDLVVSVTNGSPVYTPKKGAKVGDGLLQPLLAAAVAKVGGDWSVVTTGDGRQQYAFRGKPLYSMPDGVHVDDVEEAGGWDLVVFQKGVGTPSEIQSRITLAGDVYTTTHGLTLYQFNCAGDSGRGSSVSCDSPGDPARYWVAICGTSKECSERWKPYLAAANAKAVGEWQVIDVAYPIFTDPNGVTYPPDAPRVKAWAYRGKPVWTYYEDKEASDIWGQNVRWGHGGAFMTAVQVPGRGVARGG